MSVKQIFPNGPFFNMSSTFTLEDACALIQTKGTVPDDTFLIEYRFGEECDESWEPFTWCCGQMKFKHPQNNFIIPNIPGMYRIILVKEDSSGNIQPPTNGDFEDVEIQIRKIQPKVDISQYYPPCCE